MVIKKEDLLARASMAKPIVLEVKEDLTSPGYFIVLAKCGGFAPYVTWATNGYGYFLGHYFANLGNACEDFKKRGERG